MLRTDEKVDDDLNALMLEMTTLKRKVANLEAISNPKNREVDLYYGNVDSVMLTREVDEQLDLFP